MSDHRASIKITVEAHGVKRETDMDINWYAFDGGVDPRVREFFERWWEDCMDAYNDQIAEAEARERDKLERAEFKRLGKKFGPTEDADA